MARLQTLIIDEKKVVIHNWGGSTSFYLIYLFAYSLINFYYLVRYFCACMSKVLLKEKLNHESSMIVKEKKKEYDLPYFF